MKLLFLFAVALAMAAEDPKPVAKPVEQKKPVAVEAKPKPAQPKELDRDDQNAAMRLMMQVLRLNNQAADLEKQSSALRMRQAQAENAFDTFSQSMRVKYGAPNGCELTMIAGWQCPPSKLPAVEAKPQEK